MITASSPTLIFGVLLSIILLFSFDNGETGTAKVEEIKIHKPQGVAFNLKIITPDLSIIIYKGYMDGTIDFSIYD